MMIVQPTSRHVLIMTYRQLHIVVFLMFANPIQLQQIALKMFGMITIHAVVKILCVRFIKQGEIEVVV
ncbi:MAG: hypothetical protein A2402_01640 [Candidatus Staskawiczbacteria bacterium RIFOXYC1_FULL_37_43]|nr:MAG: hypothetical protein A2813_01835 [Candidatus Staskawiczbacteria bacterium RIFCSPHIGHO2_01_FULL_37_17]OGZ72147.1 MAG: hypothetical protein A2891_01990 [Candidatus Staskawiczbacteria bacterium RIFCSPLOWO2_01_FULL_37_19]OGZ75484.1 MAG: hypothetical protein A2205_01755 [Candidatus Staskawiczbacteria bacterium RIFOXYA1_FULL_37_15]OGZ82228.1 MAG: hypothetical protein A2402_01640 [Candidatus Staskawiczbacteria bacterium RIFOXYC1_FULL_37_43]OGZ85224.1 MAG: hypothetical protein A2490_00210 [Cand